MFFQKYAKAKNYSATQIQGNEHFLILNLFFGNKKEKKFDSLAHFYFLCTVLI